MNRKNSPIQQKIMTVIMMTSGIVLVMTCAAFFIYEYISARESARRQISILARVIASNSTAALMFDSKLDAEETLSSLQQERHILAACLFDSSGNVFAKYPQNLSESSIPQWKTSREYVFIDKHLSGFEPVIVDGKRIGMLYMKTDMKEMYERFVLYAIIAMVFILISFVFAYFISKKLQKSISDPILDLADVSRTVSEKRDYSVRAVKSSDDEVGDLTDAFNHMLTRIEQQNDQITGLNQNLELKVRERTSELESAIQLLQKETEFSGKIFDSTVDLIAVFDTELRYLTLNSKGEEMYNKSRQEMQGKYLAELFPQTLQSGMVDDLKRALKGEIVRRMNYRSLVTNRVYESYYVPLKDEQNNVYSVMAIAHDITEIVRANEKLQELNTELEKSNRELEQFAYVASHDLQEPLRKIQTFSELSERNLENPELLKKYLNKVSTSAQRMTELIKAVLNYSRLSRTENVFEEVNLEQILNNIFIDLELLINEKKAIITYDPLPAVNGIPLQLHQLFLNLITNSLKFNDREPRINIGCKNVKGSELSSTLALNTNKDYLLLEFSDNGIGFDQRFANKIFSIFQRLHNDRNFAGTGIGLALCKKIAETHEGTITVTSEVNKGTTFQIYLPAIFAPIGQLTKTSSTKK